MKILAIGDSYMPPRYFAEAFAGLEAIHEVDYRQVDQDRSFEPSTPSERKLREYQGAPQEVASWMDGVEVLVVQGAPVTDAVLGAASSLKLVCCARGGPVNVDVDAVSARGLPLVNTPGKNAVAVADLTLAFVVMLARGLRRAQRFLEDGHQLRDNWEGAQFMGSDLRRHVLGLVGLRPDRHAGRPAGAGASTCRCWRSTPTCALSEPDVEQVETLGELLRRADFVSLHARATADNRH